MIVKAFWQDRSGGKVVKYTPGDEIADDHPKRDWLLRSGIAIDESKDSKPVKAKSKESVNDEKSAKTSEAPVNDEEPAKTSVDKPKPTDSVDAHRAYLKSRKIDPKGMTRAQMIKAIAGLDD